jgi:hypothetical protein
MASKRILTCFSLALLTPLGACDLAAITGAENRLSDIDSKAVGAACRHAGRALEDCFTLYADARQSGVFEGWRDMNDYMIANKIDVIQPLIATSNTTDPAPAGDHTEKVGHKTDKPKSTRRVEKSHDSHADADAAEASPPERPWLRKRTSLKDST